MPIRAMCRCGYPFDPDRGYPIMDPSAASRDPGPWRGRNPKRYCSARCSRSWPAKDRREEKRRAAARAHREAWEAAGQLTLW